MRRMGCRERRRGGRCRPVERAPRGRALPRPFPAVAAMLAHNQSGGLSAGADLTRGAGWYNLTVATYNGCPDGWSLEARNVVENATGEVIGDPQDHCPDTTVLCGGIPE